MKRSTIVAALLLSACGSQVEDKVYGPDDYKHFSSFFTMSESSANEMSADGGTPTVAPPARDPNAAVLANKASQSPLAKALNATPANSPGVELAD